MQPDHEQNLDQIVLNRAPMIAENEPEPGKSPLDTSSLQVRLATINAISVTGRYATAGRPLAPGIT
jgi:hypothetical protein